MAEPIRRKRPKRPVKLPPGRGDQRKAQAAVLAALGDETRLLLLTRLANAPFREGGVRGASIAELTEGTLLSRQAIAKHLRVLEAVGIVRSTPAGRETLFEVDPKPLVELGESLRVVVAQWDAGLGL